MNWYIKWKYDLITLLTCCCQLLQLSVHFTLKFNLVNELFWLLNKLFFCYYLILAQYIFTGTNSEYIFSPRIINFYCGLIAQMKIQMAPSKQEQTWWTFSVSNTIIFLVILFQTTSSYKWYNTFSYSKSLDLDACKMFFAFLLNILYVWLSI